MKVVVITGSTRGIGYGLAEALLARGCSVIISGRSEDSVHKALDSLRSGDPPGEASGLACDVRSEASLHQLWDHCISEFGRVDIWVNNAGISSQPSKVWQVASEEIHAIIDTNILGSILGTKVAVRGMIAQGFGSVYLMEGMGSDGRKHAGLTLYGTTKYALDYFFGSTAEELQDTPVIIGAIRPGMVVTDLITEPYRGEPDEWARVKPIFNIIADTIETVSDWMADAILENDRNGVTLNRVSRLEMTLRFIKAPFVRRDLFEGIDLS